MFDPLVVAVLSLSPLAVYPEEWKASVLTAMEAAQPPQAKAVVVLLNGAPPSLELSMRGLVDLTGAPAILHVLREDAPEFQEFGRLAGRPKADPALLKAMKDRWKCQAVALVDASTPEAVTTLRTFVVACETAQVTATLSLGPLTLEAPGRETAPPFPPPTPTASTPPFLTLRVAVTSLPTLSLLAAHPREWPTPLVDAWMPPLLTITTQVRDGRPWLVPGPGVAHRWETAGNREWKFFLREDVKAADVKAAWEDTLRRRDPEGWIFSHVEGAEAVAAGEAVTLAGVVCESPRVLLVKLDSPDPRFPERMCGDGSRAPVSGWMLVTLQPKLMAFRHPRGGMLECLVMPELDAALIEFDLGRLDYCEVPPAAFGRVSLELGRRAGALMTSEASDTIIFAENPRLPSLRGPDVQRGLANCLDREAWVKLLWPHSAMMPTHWLPPAFAPLPPALAAQPSSLTRAHLLLATTPLPPLRLALPDRDRDLLPAADRIKREAAKLGVVINARLWPDGDWRAAARSDACDLVLFRLPHTTLHPLAPLEMLFRRPGSPLGWNIFGHGEGGLEAALEEAAAAPPSDRFDQAVERMARTAWTFPWILPVCHLKRHALVQSAHPLLAKDALGRWTIRL